MVECEKRGIPYLFKLRQTAKVKNLISLLEQEGGWVDCGQGFEGIEGEVRLGGWNCKRRMIVARRFVKQDATEDDKKALPLLTQNGELPLEVISYEYIVLASTLAYEVASLVPLYRERGDTENPFDELKSYFQVRPVFQCKSQRIINYGRIYSLAYWINDRVARQWRLCGETGEVTRILYQLQTILLGVIHIKTKDSNSSNGSPKSPANSMPNSPNLNY